MGGVDQLRGDGWQGGRGGEDGEERQCEKESNQPGALPCSYTPGPMVLLMIVYKS